MSKRDLATTPSERPGLIGKILRRTRSKQLVLSDLPLQKPASPIVEPTAAPVTLSSPAVSPSPANTDPYLPKARKHERQLSDHHSSRPGTGRSGHRSKPSLASLMQQSTYNPDDEISTALTPPPAPAPPKARPTLRSKFNKTEQKPVAPVQRVPSRDGSGHVRQHTANFSRPTDPASDPAQALQARASVRQPPPPPGRNCVVEEIQSTAFGIGREPFVEIHDGMEDDGSDYQKFVQQAVEEDRRQREVWRNLTVQSSHKAVAEATSPPPKPGIFSWQRSAAKKQKEEIRQSWTGNVQMYGFPASEASCELSRKSSKASMGSRLSRKSSFKEIIVDYIKPKFSGADHGRSQRSLARKASSQKVALVG